MLVYAEEKRGTLAGVSFRQADAQSLPFDNASFDTVVCQFGIMFFPDKAKAFAEFARVLRPGGTLVFTVWDSLEQNRVADISQKTIASFFEKDPPDFLTVPFGFHKIEPNRKLIDGAGLSVTRIQTVSTVIERPDSTSIARGFVEGNPGILQIRQRGVADPEDIIQAVARAILDEYGPEPVRIPLHEITFEALKP
jgi:SAM-dependent methyltransferase